MPTMTDLLNRAHFLLSTRHTLADDEDRREWEHDADALVEELGVALAAPAPNADGLLPCPFCSDPEPYNAGTESGESAVRCGGCRARGPVVTADRHEAPPAWNRRHTPAASSHTQNRKRCPWWWPRK